MKLKKEFITHNAGGQQILVATGKSAFAGLVKSNQTAGYIVECLKTQTTKQEIVEKMMEKYDAPKEVISADVEEVLATLKSIGALDE